MRGDDCLFLFAHALSMFDDHLGPASTRSPLLANGGIDSIQPVAYSPPHRPAGIVDL